MFEHFCEFFQVPQPKEGVKLQGITLDDVQKSTKGFAELFGTYNGHSFGKGLYRLHDLARVEQWNEIVREAFPDFPGDYTVFAYDWFGRQFALDRNTVVDGQHQILMFEPATGDILEVPYSFLEFHNETIQQYQVEALSSDLYEELREETGFEVKPYECFGCKVPFFLGGGNEMGNFEVSDMEVYWSICGQLLVQTKDLPPGTVIEIDGIE